MVVVVVLVVVEEWTPGDWGVYKAAAAAAGLPGTRPRRALIGPRATRFLELDTHSPLIGRGCATSSWRTLIGGLKKGLHIICVSL